MALNISRLSLRWSDRYPCLRDSTSSTDYDRHYVYHTSWAARNLARLNPEKHIDISSDLRFVTLVSAFLPIEFYDYRPANLRLEGLECRHADIVNLPFENDTVESLSCMHVVEHIGLGRYGDPLDSDGDLKAIAELQRVLAPGGILLFVVPVGRPRVMFNAHRIYSYTQIIEAFAGLNLEEFTLIPDTPGQGDLIKDAIPEIVDQQSYACGCFMFRKD